MKLDYKHWSSVIFGIDVKNIDLQIKTCFLNIYKNIIKNMHKNIKSQMFPITTFFAIIHAKNI